MLPRRAKAHSYQELLPVLVNFASLIFSGLTFLRKYYLISVALESFAGEFRDVTVSESLSDAAN